VKPAEKLMEIAFDRFRLALIAGLSVMLTQTEGAADGPAERFPTATPIKYLVVLYPENASFDRYFGLYPVALNPDGEPPFQAGPGTPAVNGLTETLLEHNPNQSNPFRIARLDSFTCDANHAYPEELLARNQGLMNRYVEYGASGPSAQELDPDTPALEARVKAEEFCHRNEHGNYDTDLGYFDGNTVTALWHYAQYFALSDNFFATMAGQSTRGHLNLVAGDVYGALCGPAHGDKNAVYVEGGPLPVCNGPADSAANPPPSDGRLGTLVEDTDPYYDVCSESGNTIALAGRNIGDLLSEAGITWGWFQGGFVDCSITHPKVAYDLAKGINPDTDPVRLEDYVPHHNPFQYWQSTANPRHLPPTSPDMVGHSDQAMHQYDLELFWQAAERGALPAVSFLKPPNYQNGHPAQSEPLDEQVFIVESLNGLQLLPEWRRTAVIIAWDDSDGWYDHVMPPIVNTSATRLDTAPDGARLCGETTEGPGGARCAYGPRLPFLLISPFARENFVSSALIDQSSILRFIEDNWLGGQRISATSFDNIAGSIEGMFDFSRSRETRRLFLDPYSGQRLERPPRPDATP
jgi:phospholipase C